MFKYYGTLGIIIFIISYVLGIKYDFSPISLGANLGVYLHIIGLSLFFDALNFKINQSSFLSKIKNRWSIALYLFLGGSFFGLFSEFFGFFILRLWWQPADDLWVLFSMTHKLSLILPIVLPTIFYYTLIFFNLLNLYMIFGYFINRFNFKIKFNLKKDIFPCLGWIGLIFLIIPLVLIKFTDLNLLDKTVILFALYLGLWFLLEYVGYLRNKRGLLKDILGLNFNPLISIIFSFFILGSFIEIYNLFIRTWTYHNFSFSNIQILGIPLSAFMIFWLPASLFFLSFYRTFIEEPENL